MPADASIYSLIRPQAQPEGPLDQYGKMISVKSLMGNEQLNEMQRTKLARDMQRDENFQKLFEGATPEQMAAPDFLRQALAADPARGMALQKSLLDQRKAQADLDKTQVETRAATAKEARDALATVTDQPSLDNFVQLGKQRGWQVAAQAPAAYDSKWVRQHLVTADQYIAQSTPKYEKLDLGGRTVTVDMNPVTNPGIAKLNLSKTPTPGELMANKVALANLAIKGAEATPGGVFSIPGIVAGAQGGGGAPAGAAPGGGMVTPASLLRAPQNALPQAAVASPAQAGPAQAAQPAATAPAAGSSNPVQAAIQSGKSGDELLKMLPTEISSQVKQMVEGRMAPPTSMALGKPYWQGMLQLANAYDPKFDETVWKARNTTRTAFDVGAEGKNVTKINTAIGHLDSFDKAAQALNNGSLPFVNYVSNTLLPQLGNTELAGKIRTFQQAKEAVANELMSVFRGVGASSGDTAKWAETLNSSDSPEALRAAVKSAVELLDSRIGALGEQYKRGMSMSSDVNVLGMVYPKAQATLDRLRAGKPAGQTDAGKIVSATAKPTGGIKFLGFE